LGIKLPELGVHLLLKHLLLDSTSLVNKLLLALDGGSIVVELGVLLAKSVVGSFEFHVLASGHLVSSLLLSLGLEGLETLEHLLTDLLGSFQVVVKFLFIDAVLGGEKVREAGLPLLQVGGLSLAHILNAVLDDVIVDQLGGLSLPHGLVCKVAIALDVVNHGGLFLRGKGAKVREAVSF